MDKISAFLMAAAALALCSCGPKDAPREVESPSPQKAPEGTVFLTQRYARTTPTGVIAFNPGTLAKVLDRRPGFVTLAVGQTIFEVPEAKVATSMVMDDNPLSNSVTDATAKIPDPVPAQTIQPTSAQLVQQAKISNLQTTIKASRAELQALNKAYTANISSTPSTTYIATQAAPGVVAAKAPSGDSPDSPENKVRRARMAALQAYITQCQTELRRLQSE